MATLSVIWWRDIPAQVVAKDARRSSKVVLHPRFQVAIDKAANRAGKRAYNDYIAEWRKIQRPCGDDLEAEVRTRSRSARGRLRQAPPGRADPVRRRRRRTRPAARHLGDLADMTETRAQLRQPRGRHRLRPAVRDHRRADQPDRPEAPGRGDEGRRLQPGRARRARPGRGRRAHARRQRRDPAERRAGDPRPHDPARPGPDRPAAVDRLVDRRGARGRAGRLPGQGPGQLRDRRGGAPRARPAARPQVRRRGRRDQQRRLRDQRGSRTSGSPSRSGSSSAPRTTGSRPRTSSSIRWSCRSERCRRPAARSSRWSAGCARSSRSTRSAAPPTSASGCRTGRGSTRRSCRWRSRSGMTSAITNPLMPEVKAAVMAADVLMGHDPDCGRWILANRDARSRRRSRPPTGQPPRRRAGRARPPACRHPRAGRRRAPRRPGRGARHLHAVRPARPVRHRHDRARRRALARRRHRFGLRRARDLRPLPGQPGYRRVPQARDHLGGRTTCRRSRRSRRRTATSTAWPPTAACRARPMVRGDVLVDVPPESQVHRQVVRKGLDVRTFTVDPVVRLHYVEVTPAGAGLADRRPRPAVRGARARVGPDRPRGRPRGHPAAPAGTRGRQVRRDGRGPRRRARSSPSGPACTSRRTASPSTSARPRSPATSPTSPTARSWPATA